MSKGFRQYIYKGWQVRASEYYGNWECQPSYSGENANELWENFVNNEYITFKTLKEAKAWVNTEEAKQLKKKYSKL